MSFFVFVLFGVILWGLWSRTNMLLRRIEKLDRENDQLRRMLERGETPPASAPEPELEAEPESVDTRDDHPAAPERVREIAALGKPAQPAGAKTLAPSQPTPPAFDPADAIVKLVKRLGPNDPNMGWEMALGTYWLPRIGMFALTVAIVFLLTLAWQTWGPPPPWVRVTVAYAVCATLLLGGWRLERRYPAYARVLYGGGIAGTYFVSFATHYVPFARIFDSPVPSLALLALVVLAWSGIAQTRHSPVVAALVTFLGHLTIAIATFSVDRAAPYSVVGIVLLSAGSAYFLLRNRWYYVAALGIVGSYVNHFFVLMNSESAHTVQELAVGLTVLTIYFLIYALAEFFAPERLRRESIPIYFRTGFAALNTACYFGLGMLVLAAYDFTEGHRHLFPYALALGLLALGWAYLHKHARDPLFNAYITKATAVVTIGLALHFEGNVLTTALAIEVVTLLIAARRSGLVVTRILAIGAGVLAFLHGLYTITASSPLAYAAPGYWGELLPAALVLAAFWTAALLYLRTDWDTRSPANLPFNADARLFLWQFDLSTKPQEAGNAARKPLDGQLFPHLYSLAAAMLCMGYAMTFAGFGDRILAFSGTAAVLIVLAFVLRAFPFAVASLVLFIAAFLSGIAEIARDISPYIAIPAFGLLGLNAFFTERRYIGDHAALMFHQQSASPYVLYGGVLILIAFYLTETFYGVYPVFAVAALALACAAALHLLDRGAMECGSIALLLWAQFLWHRMSGLDSVELHVSAWTLALLAVAADRYYARLTLPILGRVAIAALWFLAMHYVLRASTSQWYGLLWSIAGGAFLAYAIVFRMRVAAIASVAAVACAGLFIVAHAYAARPGSIGAVALVASFGAPIVMVVVFERLTKLLSSKLDIALPPITAVVFVASASTLAVLMLERIELLAEFFLTISWSVMGVVLFGISIAFREKLYRYAGLCVLLLASLRVLAVDTRELETVYKVFAWAVLGAVLLALGFGYVKAFAQKSEPGTPDESPAQTAKPE